MIQRYNLEPAKAEEILELKNNLETLKGYDLNSVNVLNELVSQGGILSTIEIGAESVYMTKSAIRDIKACESKLRALQAFDVIDRTEYEKAYDDTSAIMPKRVVVRGFCGDKRIFAQAIRNW